MVKKIHENWYLSNTKEYIGLILQGQTLQATINEFHLWVRVIKPVLSGNDNWKLISLLPLRKPVIVKEHILPRSIAKEEKLQELHQMGITAFAHSAFSSLV